MKLEQLKDFLDEVYGFDIKKNTRLRNYAYAKKVFIRVARDYGYRWIEMEPVIGQTHDLLIYHHDTFNTIKPIDLEKYNICIEHFNLPMEKIPSMSWFLHGEKLMSIIEKMKNLSGKNLRYFERHRLDKFLKEVEREEEIKNMNLG